MRWISIFVLIFIVVVISGSQICMAAVDENGEEKTDVDDFLPKVDYSEIEKAIDDAGGRELSFSDSVDSVRKEGYVGISSYLQAAIECIANEFINYKKTMIILFSCAVLSSICVSYFSGNTGRQMGETGCYVAYMFMCITIIGVYKECYQAALSTIEGINSFMSALIPAYVAVTAFSTGSMSATGYYGIAFVLIEAVNVIIKSVILPLAGVYMLINISDNLLSDTHFGKMKNLVLKFSKTLMKLMMVLLCGISVIQRMILPYRDALKRQTIFAAIKSLPAVNGALSGLNDIVFSSALVLRNSIGVTAIVSLLVIISLPVMKILTGMAILKISAAITEPVTDKRISNGIEGGAKAIGIILMAIIAAAGLFIVSLAMASGG